MKHFYYDANGNMTRDDYRALNLSYNSFNLPWELDFGDCTVKNWSISIQN